MRKKDLVEMVWVKVRMGLERGTRSRLKVSRGQADTIVEAVIGTLAEALENGDSVVLPRFGRFSLKKFAPGSKVFSPKTGDHVPRRDDRLITVRFKVSSVLRDRVNKAQPRSSGSEGLTIRVKRDRKTGEETIVIDP